MEPAQKTRADIYLERVGQTFQLDPQVRITLKGVTYTLEFNNRAMKEVLKDCGFNALKDSLSAEAMESPEILGSLLYRGLKTHHPDVTADQVDMLFTSRHYPYIISRLRAAMEMFLPDMSDVPRADEQEGASDPNPAHQPMPRG